VRHALLLATCLGAVLGGACDEVGAPLVGRRPPPPASPPTIGCTLPLECEPRAAPEVAPERSASPIDLGSCGGAASRSCVLRAPAGDVEDGLGELGMDEGADAGPLVADSQMSCTPALAAAGAECEALELVAEGGEHVLTGLALRRVNLSIRATHPTLLTLDEADLESVFVAMRGPITLRVSRAQAALELRVVTTAGAEGEPALELLDVDGHDVQVGTKEGRFDGDVRFDRAHLQDTTLVVERLELESVAVEASRIEARTLTGADVQIVRSSLALGDALLSAFTLIDAHIERCDALTLLSGHAVRIALPACSGPPTRVYDTKVIDGHADGWIESDSSIWERVAFGVTTETRLVAFGGTLRSVNLCQATLGPMLGDGLAVSCSKCDGWSRPEQLPCQLKADEELTRYSNFCALLDVTTYAACPAPVPERERPLMLPF
jgi:hypothetical protein